MAKVKSDCLLPQGFLVYPKSEKWLHTNSTSSEALARCDAQEIVTVFANILLKARAVAQCGSDPSRLQANKQQETLTHVAMDGKTVRGTLGHESEGQPKVASV